MLFLFFKIIFFKFLYQYNFETTQNVSLHVLIRYKHVHDSLQYMYGICIDLLSHLSLSFSTLECLCKCCRYKYVCKYIDKSTTWPKIAQLCVNAGKTSISSQKHTYGVKLLPVYSGARSTTDIAASLRRNSLTPRQQIAHGGGLPLSSLPVYTGKLEGYVIKRENQSRYNLINSFTSINELSCRIASPVSRLTALEALCGYGCR